MKMKSLMAPITFAALILLTACGDPTPIEMTGGPTSKPTNSIAPGPQPDATATAAGKFQVVGVDFKAEQAQAAGLCPLTVKFSGHIKVNGAGQVKYTFVRSDGATAPVYTLDFSGEGAQPVSTTWTLGDAERLPSYAGWQRLKVLSPNAVETSSESGAFSVVCQR